ncbi:MAG TPA: FtsX-like permease family protein [Gemmatimonadaceae bacterium]|nr:FtsX-like permease family protein [Gemmatimonadaceae bacterium]
MIASHFRTALRSVRRRPAFFAVAVSSLGIALGLATAVFGMIDALRHPLMSNDGADQIVGFGARGQRDPSREPLTSKEFEALLTPLPGLAELTAYRNRVWFAEGNAQWRRRTVHEVLPNYTRVMGLRPAKGRLFGDDDFARGDVAILSDMVWRSEFNNRENLDNATIKFEGKTYLVIGVLKPHAQAADALIPTTRGALETRMRGYYTVRGRLAAGWTHERMRPALDAVSAQVRERHGSGSPPWYVTMGSVRPDPIALKDAHFAMIGAAIGILLIACANVAALMLARGVSNRREYALHLALGARPSDLMRGVVAEVTTIAVFGAIAGAFVAMWATQILTVSVPENLNNLGLPTPQWSVRVFAMSFAAMLGAIALASAGPAWLAARTNPHDPIKDSAGTTTGRSSSRFRVLVVTEMALSMTLLVGASLMAKSVREIANPDLGYDPRALFRASVRFPADRRASTHERVQAVHASLDRIRSLPGVSTAAMYSVRAPDSLAIVSDVSATGGGVILFGEDDVYTVTGPGYFETIGVPVVSGRTFVEGDRARGAIVLSRRAERALFPRGSSIGHQIKLGSARSTQPWYEVVGVVADVELEPRDKSATEDPVPPVYAFLPDSNASGVSIIARARSDVERVAAEAFYLMQDLSPAGSSVGVQTWQTVFGQVLRTARYVGRLFVMLGLASLVLAAAGLFSVLAYAVSQRMREFAVRMALGARQVNVVRLVLRDAMIVALGGTAIGAVFGMWTSFLIWDLLYEVYPVDAEALVIAEATLLLAALIASIVPAIRATRANPVDVMRAT